LTAFVSQQMKGNFALQPLFTGVYVIYSCKQWLKCKIKGGRTLHSGLGP